MARNRTVKHLRDHLSVFEAGYPMQKGYIARRLLVDGYSIPDVFSEVQSIVQAAETSKCLNEGSLTRSLYKFKRLIFHKKRSLTTEWQSLIRLFLEPYPITLKSLPVMHDPQPGHTLPIQHSILEPDTPQRSALTPLSSIENVLYLSPSCRLPSPKKLKRDCENCVAKQRTVISMEFEKKRLQQEIQKLKIQLKEKQRSQFSLKRTNEKIKRKIQSSNLWRAKCKTFQRKYDEAKASFASINYFKKIVKDLKSTLECKVAEIKRIEAVNVNLQCALQDTNSKMKSLQNNHDEIRAQAQITESRLIKKLHEVKKEYMEKTAELENENEILKERVEESRVIETKRHGIYDVKLRRCIYEFLLNNVSVANVSNLLRCIAEFFFDATFAELPSVRTITQMAIEVGILSDIHVGYVLDKCTSATLGWDGTTKGGKHLNTVNVTVFEGGVKKSLILNVSSLSGGATQQLHNNIIESLSDVCKTYSEAFNINDADVRHRIFHKIKCTMSDRAPVNHAVHRELEQELGETVELKCGVHPLDGLAQAARRVLHRLDVEHHRSTADVKPALGCRAAQLLYRVSKLRYKDGSGDPATFVAFLKKHCVQPSSILRYVGNRLHVMFHMAATVHSHRAIVIDFLKSRNKRQLCSQILKGLMDPSIQVQLQVLGLFSKYLTGPWMRMFYEPEDGLGHLKRAEAFKPCMQALKSLLDRPEGLLNTRVDAFGNEMMDVQPELKDMEVATSDEFVETVKCLLNEFIVVLERQLKDYFDGTIATESPEMIELTASAPIHNMHSERTLAMMDALMRRAPHANLCFSEAKTKATLNHTLVWLDSLPNHQLQQLVDFAMHQAMRVRQRTCERERANERVALQKNDEACRAAYEKKLKAAVAQIGLVPALLQLKIFNDLDSKSRIHLERFLTDNSCLSNVILRHVWHQDGQDCVYFEMVRNVGTTQTKDKCKKVIDLWYWREHDELSGDFCSMNVKQFLVDFALGDLSVL